MREIEGGYWVIEGGWVWIDWGDSVMVGDKDCGLIASVLLVEFEFIGNLFNFIHERRTILYSFVKESIANRL